MISQTLYSKSNRIKIRGTKTGQKISHMNSARKMNIAKPTSLNSMANRVKDIC